MSKILFNSNLKTDYLKRTDIGEALVVNFIDQQLKNSDKLDDLIEEKTIYDILKSDLSTIEKIDLVYRYIPLDRTASERFEKSIILVKLAENIMNSINEERVLDSDDLLFRMIESFKEGSIEQIDSILEDIYRSNEEKKLVYFAAYLTLNDKDLKRLLDDFKNFSEERLKLYREIEKIARKKIPEDMIPFKKSEIIHLVNHIFDRHKDSSNLSERVLQLYEEFKKENRILPYIRKDLEVVRVTPDSLDQFVEERRGINSNVVFDSVTMFDLLEKIYEKGRFDFYIRGHITYINLPSRLALDSFNWYKKIGGIYSKNMVYSADEIEKMSQFLQSITYNSCLNIYTLSILHEINSLKNSFLEQSKDITLDSNIQDISMQLAKFREKIEELHSSIQTILDSFVERLRKDFFQVVSYSKKNENYLNEGLKNISDSLYELKRASSEAEILSNIHFRTGLINKRYSYPNDINELEQNREFIKKTVNSLLDSIRSNFLFLDRIDYSFPEITRLIDRYTNISKIRSFLFFIHKTDDQKRVYINNTLLLLPGFNHTIDNFFLTKSELQKVNKIFSRSYTEKDIFYSGYSTVSYKKNPYNVFNYTSINKNYVDTIISRLREDSLKRPLLLNSLFHLLETHRGYKVKYNIDNMKQNIVNLIYKVELLPSILNSISDKKEHLTYLDLQDVKNFSTNCLNSNLSLIKDRLTLKQRDRESEVEK